MRIKEQETRLTLQEYNDDDDDDDDFTIFMKPIMAVSSRNMQHAINKIPLYSQLVAAFDSVFIQFQLMFLGKFVTHS